MNHHEHFMRRCLALAEEGRGNVGNGALVGAVIVRDGAIIGEGKFSGAGKDHAETEAIKSVQKFDSSFDKAQDDTTLYINLEPCVPHPTKTTPGCVPRIIDSGIARVVVGMVDPDERVAGRGIAALRAAGIDVTMSDLRAECEWLNRGYVSARTKGRPWVTLKRAQTRDGRIASPDGSPRKITAAQQDAWSHTFLRATHDAILVGSGTILADDPSLNTRFDQKKRLYQPWRVVLDVQKRIPKTAKILTDDHRDRTLILTTESWEGLWKELLDRGITSVLVEGGQQTWDAFRAAQCVDADVTLVGA